MIIQFTRKHKAEVMRFPQLQVIRNMGCKAVTIFQL
jgi:hypothetical protein